MKNARNKQACKKLKIENIHQFRLMDIESIYEILSCIIFHKKASHSILKN